MKPQIKHLLYWSPRILCVLYVGYFLSIFIIDELGKDMRFLEKLSAFLVYFSPAFLILIILVPSWKWEWIGGLGFIALAITYLVIDVKHPVLVAEVSIPLFSIGILFLMGWFYRKKTGRNLKYYTNHVHRRNW